MWRERTSASSRRVMGKRTRAIMFIIRSNTRRSSDISYNINVTNEMSACTRACTSTHAHTLCFTVWKEPGWPADRPEETTPEGGRDIQTPTRQQVWRHRRRKKPSHAKRPVATTDAAGNSVCGGSTPRAAKHEPRSIPKGRRRPSTGLCFLFLESAAQAPRYGTALGSAKRHLDRAGKANHGPPPLTCLYKRQAPHRTSRPRPAEERRSRRKRRQRRGDGGPRTPRNSRVAMVCSSRRCDAPSAMGRAPSRSPPHPHPLTARARSFRRCDVPGAMGGLP